VELKTLFVLPRFQRKNFKMRLFASHGTAREVIKRIIMKSSAGEFWHLLTRFQFWLKPDSSNSWHESRVNREIFIRVEFAEKKETHVSFSKALAVSQEPLDWFSSNLLLEARLACFTVFTGPSEVGSAEEGGHSRTATHWVGFITIWWNPRVRLCDSFVT
jgi:hypothetical protein